MLGTMSQKNVFFWHLPLCGHCKIYCAFQEKIIGLQTDYQMMKWNTWLTSQLMIHSCKFETCSLSKDSGSSQLRSKDDDKMMKVFILMSMNVAIMAMTIKMPKLFFYPRYDLSAQEQSRWSGLHFGRSESDSPITHKIWISWRMGLRFVDTYVGELVKKCHTESLTVMSNGIRPNLDFFCVR